MSSTKNGHDKEAHTQTLGSLITQSRIQLVELVQYSGKRRGIKSFGKVQKFVGCGVGHVARTAGIGAVSFATVAPHWDGDGFVMYVLRNFLDAKSVEHSREA